MMPREPQGLSSQRLGHRHLCQPSETPGPYSHVSEARGPSKSPWPGLVRTSTHAPKAAQNIFFLRQFTNIFSRLPCCSVTCCRSLLLPLSASPVLRFRPRRAKQLHLVFAVPSKAERASWGDNVERGDAAGEPENATMVCSNVLWHTKLKENHQINARSSHVPFLEGRLRALEPKRPRVPTSLQQSCNFALQL